MYCNCNCNDEKLGSLSDQPIIMCCELILESHRSIKIRIFLLLIRIRKQSGGFQELHLNSFLFKIMFPMSVRQPGDVVNKVYSQNIQSIIQMCIDVGDDPNLMIEEVKHQLHVKDKKEGMARHKSKRIFII